MERFILIDDGTMDTVIQDTVTGEYHRGTYEASTVCEICEDPECEDDIHAEMEYVQYVNEFMSYLEEEIED